VHAVAAAVVTVVPRWWWSTTIAAADGCAVCAAAARLAAAPHVAAAWRLPTVPAHLGAAPPPGRDCGRPIAAAGMGSPSAARRQEEWPVQLGRWHARSRKPS